MKICKWNPRIKKTCRSAERRWRKSKLTVHYEIFRQLLKSYNKTVKQAIISHFSILITNNSKNPRFLFSTFDLLTNKNFNQGVQTPTDALCEDFADHFVSKIDVIRSSILTNQNQNFYTSGQPLLSEETLESFALVDARTLGRVFSQVKPTTCLLDPIPTSLLKSLYGFFEEQILYIVNCSLQTGVFPAAFRTVVVRPHLKRSNLDQNILITTDHYPIYHF